MAIEAALPAETAAETTATVLTKAGEAPIKAEYLLPRTEKPSEKPNEESNEQQPSEQPNEQLTEQQSTEKPTGKKSGQNKQRNKRNKPQIARDRICRHVAIDAECPQGDACPNPHDVAAFMATKEPDLGTQCPVFDALGRCPFGLRCRFAMAHTTEDWKQVVDEEKAARAPAEPVRNAMSRDMQIRLRKRVERFPRTLAFDAAWQAEHGRGKGSKTEETEKIEETAEPDKIEKTEETVEPDKTDKTEQADRTEADDTMKAHPAKRQRARRVDFRGKTYLAPLTTVGNLPFRRVCKGFGVDITCSEMAIANNIVQGQGSELALLKRHASEDIFGVQLAGSRADMVGKAAEFVGRHCDVDFIDLNLGCPVELAFNNGGGSALLAQPRKIERIVRTMAAVVDCDVTVKFRTGIRAPDVAEKLAPQLRAWGAALGTLHGRTRQQRYTRLADWECIGRARDLAAPLPLFGGGDVLSWEDYWDHVETRRQCDGVMVGRGALIKPWLFQEIRERRVWDISASERLDMLRDFARFGLEHWGSDTIGVANTRRFLLEWQSFLCRYVPAGLLEVLPQRINDRPPPFVGRSDLETLMASHNAADWVRISEMVLGPAPPDFAFVPKHKSNSY
ncbi:tRNA-dihydrouridine(47) synthase [NAD(P)(+)]-like protein [Coemansia sp. RSA 2611]|nr:tRNA-dihydrouridine(47) synthase [NAD(P)(+)]-like protein [Coemansia sp. RSA 2611]